MTVGAVPELLALGYLRNQRLVRSIDDIASVQVDWEVEACSITSRDGIADLTQRTAGRRVVTTGCGQGTAYASLMDEVGNAALDPATRLNQTELYALPDAMPLHDSLYKSAGPVHGSDLFEGSRLLMFTEDVGRHNAVDAISGWMWLHGVNGAGKVFYTTGRLTSEMAIKCALMGVSLLVSRSGVTQMGYDIAERLGIALFARAPTGIFCFTRRQNASRRSRWRADRSMRWPTVACAVAAFRYIRALRVLYSAQCAVFWRMLAAAR